jgi:uncharacterized membrane protein YeiH
VDPSSIESINYWIGMAGTVAFAVTAVLAGRQNLLMKRELYAIPVLLGCAAFALVLKYSPEQRLMGGATCGIGIFAFRAAAIRWNLSVPDWLPTKAQTVAQYPPSLPGHFMLYVARIFRTRGRVC